VRHGGEKRDSARDERQGRWQMVASMRPQIGRCGCGRLCLTCRDQLGPGRCRARRARGPLVPRVGPRRSHEPNRDEPESGQQHEQSMPHHSRNPILVAGPRATANP
jgi:hypothetical protein